MVNPEGQTGRDGGDAEEVTQVSHQSADSALCLTSSAATNGVLVFFNPRIQLNSYRNTGMVV